MIIVGPLWFLNLILIVLNFFLVIFLGINHNQIKINFILNNKNKKQISLIKSEIPFLPDITERDIFNTINPITKKEKKIYIYQPQNLVNHLYPPEFPKSLPMQAPIISEKEILPPLQITLHGTIINDNPMKNKVFIENIRTKEEKDYGIGEIIEDAQIVFINKNKVIFVRSNGQEESIHLNKLFKIEEEASLNNSWNNVISIKNNIRYIDIDLFRNKIKSLASFIEKIGLETYFENGIATGCLIKNIKDLSLGHLLGFLDNDLIISINNIPVNTIESRMLCLNLILDNFLDSNFIIDIAFKRNNFIKNLQFKCFKNEKKNISKSVGLFKVSEKELSEKI